jgi:hypothetical protein
VATPSDIAPQPVVSPGQITRDVDTTPDAARVTAPRPNPPTSTPAEMPPNLTLRVAGLIPSISKPWRAQRG